MTLKIERSVGESPTERARITWHERTVEVSRLHVHLACWLCAVMIGYLISLFAGTATVAHVAPLAGGLPDLAREISDRLFNF